MENLRGREEGMKDILEIEVMGFSDCLMLQRKEKERRIKVVLEYYVGKRRIQNKVQ